MSDKPKVLCRCGQPMYEKVIQSSAVNENYRWCVDYICECGWHSPLRYGKTREEAHNAAYAAATRRPPNRALVVVPIYREEPNPLSDNDDYYKKIAGWVPVKQFMPLQGKDMLFISGEQPDITAIEAVRNEGRKV